MQICVYCASSNSLPEFYFSAARALGRGIAERGWALIYGGGSVGLMGALAEAVHAAHGRVIGVIPQALLDREVGYRGADELVVTTTLRERKQIMDDRATVFVALPGGFGTLEELLEIITLRQLGYHDKPILILNTSGYFDPLLAQFELMFAQGFANTRYREMYQVFDTVDAVLAHLELLNRRTAEPKNKEQRTAR
jgi:hypothetical protein